MSVLVADVGGTNTRLAILEPSGNLSAPQRYSNDSYASFEAVLEAFGPQKFDGCVIAIAGPVTRDRAQLTNRNWVFHRPTIARQLGLPGPDSVRLMNDLAALGHALPGVRSDQLSHIRPIQNSAGTNGQALVVGIGTGFNVALVKLSQQQPVVLEAELGHACPPASVSHALAAAWGDAPERFVTNEDVFSGRGLAKVHQLLAGGTLLTGPDILANYENDVAAAHTVDLLAELLGLLTQQLIYMYLPFDGVYFAGGVARGILGSPARGHFLNKLKSPGPFADQTDRVAVRLINDDAAALGGIAGVATSAGLLHRDPV
ncbi:glucokinase [Phaeobacter marinintestinus]|uniref:glucokinase n=1 Tax=Falsiphaeobacter marinintestinus TaxID=1492905 RepID=UPI0011B51A4D|nr:glucokinase [Phaeobacter marinintestinus]